MAHHYIAQFLPQEDGTFCVFFPDLEGCNTFGDTLQEAFEAAQDAATGWLEVEADRGTPLPVPSGLAAAKAKAEAHCRELEIDVPEGTLYQLVPVDPQPEKPVRVNMTFAPRVLDIKFDMTTTDIPHPNTLDFAAFDKDGNVIGKRRVCSVGGGAIEIEG